MDSLQSYFTRFVIVLLVFISSYGTVLSNDSINLHFFQQEEYADSIFFQFGFSPLSEYFSKNNIPPVIQVFLKAKYNFYLSNYKTAYDQLDSIKNTSAISDYVSTEDFNELYSLLECCYKSRCGESYEKMRNQIQEYFKNMHFHTINNYLLSYAFTSKYIDLDNSKKILESSNEFVIKNYGNESFIYHLIRFYIAENLFCYLNFESSSKAFEFTLKQSVKQFPHEDFFKRAYYYEGIQNWNQIKLTEAQKNFQQFLDGSPNHYYHYRILAHYFLGNIYRKQNDKDKDAIKHLKASMDIALVNNYTKGYLDAGLILLENYYITNHTKEYYELFAEISNYFKGKSTTFQEEILIASMFSRFYYRDKNYEECIKASSPIFQKLSAIVDLDTINQSLAPNYLPVLYYSNLNDLYWSKIRANYYLWKKSGDISFLYESYKDSKAYFELKTYHLNNQSDRKSRLQKLKRYKEVVNDIYSPGYQLWEETHDTVIFNEMLNFMDRSRSVLFRTSLKDISLKEQMGISSELISSERRIKRAIDSIDILLMQNKLSNNEMLEKELITLYRCYDSIKFQIEKEHPGFKSLSRQSTFYSYEKIQENLPPNATLICYQLTHNAIYIQLINGSSITFTYSDLDKKDLELIQEYYNLISNYTISMFESQSFEKFVEYSTYFYSLLIEPVVKDITGDKLYILPDKQLNYIPFDLLLKEEMLDSANSKSYATLPYLINNYSISILYSLEQLFKVKDVINNPRVLALSPTYTDSGDVQTYKYLSGASEEVDYLKMKMEGRFFKGEKATKQVLQRASDNFDILHLALHTNVNSDEPLYSQLLFNSDTSDYDNNLFIYETYGLKLSTPMVMLGGCSTGFGSMFSGEGILNLARNFFYMGAQNTIAAQWPIADKSGSKITAAFYDELRKGIPSDMALRNAKLKYIASSGDLECHPYFWASMQSIGTPVTFTFNNSYGPKTRYWIWILITTGLLIGGYIFKRLFFQ